MELGNRPGSPLKFSIDSQLHFIIKHHLVGFKQLNFGVCFFWSSSKSNMKRGLGVFLAVKGEILRPVQRSFWTLSLEFWRLSHCREGGDLKMEGYRKVWFKIFNLLSKLEYPTIQFLSAASAIEPWCSVGFYLSLRTVGHLICIDSMEDSFRVHSLHGGGPVCPQSHISERWKLVTNRKVSLGSLKLRGDRSQWI